MENDLNTCLMLAVNLNTPVDLGCVFSDIDLKDTGIELDSHVTILYAQSKEIPKKDILQEMKKSLGDSFPGLLKICKDETEVPLFDLFTLGKFENDSDYVVLKLKDNNEIFGYLEMLNTDLSKAFGVTSDFANYTPHLTLAELQPGTADKYLESEQLKLILGDTLVSFEDLFMSYGSSNEPEDRKQYNLTTYKCVDRYFRLLQLKKFNEELRK